jgi:hypothetical protein
MSTPVVKYSKVGQDTLIVKIDLVNYIRYFALHAAPISQPALAKLADFIEDIGRS